MGWSLGELCFPEHSQTFLGTFLGFSHPDCKGRGSWGTQTCSGSGGSRSPLGWHLLPSGSFSCLSGQVPLPQCPTLYKALTASAGSAGGAHALKNPLCGVEENPRDELRGSWSLPGASGHCTDPAECSKGLEKPEPPSLSLEHVGAGIQGSPAEGGTHSHSFVCSLPSVLVQTECTAFPSCAHRIKPALSSGRDWSLSQTRIASDITEHFSSLCIADS